MSLKWHTTAGGGASRKNGYSTSMYAFGRYMISPISNQWGRHMGYRLHFLNEKGVLGGGLWQQIGSLWPSPNAAKGAAKTHYEKHFAKKGKR